MIKHSTLQAIAVVLAILGSRAFAAEPSIQFNRDVRPILTEYCFSCHGPDAKHAEGNLRLDLRESATKPDKFGNVTIAPGKPDESELIVRILSTDKDEMMPPPKTHKTLSDKEKNTLKQWIAEGAAYQGHWSFIAPQKPATPAVKDASWPRNEIDRFILAKLETENLKPSPEADRRTLIRRVSLDVRGLPPTPQEVQQFLADSKPDAYERMVDRMLASPAFGERMAMWWLDGARFADSHGFQSDSQRYMWPWRDYVIKSFNDNKPFDRFTVEQIAGDLLPNATLEQKVATGFNRNHRMNGEGGSLEAEWLVENVMDRVETTSQVWLGLTMGCARCHDHKYDPITMKDFYSFFAFFHNVPEKGVVNGKPMNFEPLVRVATDEQNQKLEALAEAVTQAKAAVKAEEGKIAAKLQAWEASRSNEPIKSAWMTQAPASVRAASSATLTVQADASVLVSGENPAKETYTVELKPSLRKITGFKLEALPHESLAGKGPGRSVNGNFVLTDVRVEAAGKKVRLVSAKASFSQSGYPVANAINSGGSATDGWAIHPQVGQPHFATFAFDKPVDLPADKSLVVTLDFQTEFGQHQLGHFRLSVTDAKNVHEAGSGVEQIAKILATPAAQRTDKQRKELTAYFRANHADELLAAEKAVLAAEKAYSDYEAAVPTVMVMAEMPKPRETFILIRGQYDHPGEAVTMAVPAALHPLPKGAPVNRLGLAQWIVDPANPLTSRVTVNRFWEMLFGVGIVKSSENLGVQAEWPSHPELLDYLATEFVASGWDVKAMYKRMLTSSTYRQASKVTPDLLARDPENRLLARGPRFRLQAELVRDVALSASGLLNPAVGGPSVRPYQPEGVWDETSVYGNLRNYKRGGEEELYRRSMYTIWKRTAAPPNLTMFDMPNREICQVKRARTNTPLQALALMNEVTYLEAARVLAQRMLTEAGQSPAERIQFACERVLSRPASPAELAVLQRGLEARLERYQKDPASASQLVAVGDSKPDFRLQPAELAAYTLTASVILNLDEAITKE